VLVIHGLGNAVLPMRGIDAVGPGVWIPAIALLYIAAIIGFAAAGFGTLGVRPLDHYIVPSVWIAAICSLFAHVRAAQGDLWIGVVLSVALPIVTTWWATTSVPGAAPGRMNVWKWTSTIVGLLVFAWIAVAAVSWPVFRGWGTSIQEWQIALPGDREPRTPSFEILHGVTIDAPPSAVWPWLAQLGQDRAGFYSYDWLERAFGADIHNVGVIRPEWQTREVGDQVFATQAGYLGGLFGERPGWTIERFDANRAMVLKNWGAFVIVATPEGGTRLLVRSTISHERIPAWAAALNLAGFQLPHFIMQRRMLLGIKALAEQTNT
jgi:hypothetical protein